MITYKIHLLRHGIAEGNLEGRYIGSTDAPLCEEGLEKLRLFKECCTYPTVQKLFVSPLLRCRQTAELLYPAAFTQTLDDLRECDFGVFENRLIADLKKDPLFDRWVRSGMKDAPCGGESSQALEARACEALDFIFGEMMAKKLTSVGVITHGGILMTLLQKYAYPRREKAYDWIVPNGTGYTIQMTPQMWMRDEGFEVYEPIPYRYEALLRLGPDEYKKQLRDWEEEQEKEPSELNLEELYHE